MTMIVTLIYRCGCRREHDAAGLSQEAQAYLQRNAAKNLCFAYCKKRPESQS
jgi:hypothetical protein